MKYLKGYKLLNEESNTSDDIYQLINDRLIDLKDLDANISIDTWYYDDLNGYIEISNLSDDDKDLDKMVYNVRIYKTLGKYSNPKSAYIYDSDSDRDGDKISEVNIEPIYESAKILGEVANFISMAKGEDWLVFMDDSDITSKLIRINFFIIPKYS